MSPAETATPTRPRTGAAAHLSPTERVATSGRAGDRRADDADASEHDRSADDPVDDDATVHEPVAEKSGEYVAETARGEVPDDEELAEAIILASRALDGIAARSLAGSADDVTLAQYRTLLVLEGGGPRRLADLAEALGVSPSTATRMCDRLVRKQLVVRTRDESDRREVNLAISPAGRRIVADVTHRRRDEVHSLLETVPGGLRRQLVRSLTSLASSAVTDPGSRPTPTWS